jgi:hypothetical protein
MVKRSVSAILVLLACALPAWALDGAGNYFVRGVGNELCAAYSIARDRLRDEPFAAWLAGYLSGFDRWTADVYDIEGATGFEGSLHWLDYYCRQHPQLPFSTAAESLVADLYANRARGTRTAGASAPH